MNWIMNGENGEMVNLDQAVSIMKFVTSRIRIACTGYTVDFNYESEKQRDAAHKMILTYIAPRIIKDV